jgi:P-type Ca2+ transporter type 2C
LEISLYDLVVGDVLLLEAGDIVSVDAILIEGNDFKCDESSVTGETETLQKVPADLAIKNASLEVTKYSDPFIISGSKVLDGAGRVLVTAVGINSCYGRMMLCMSI